MHDLLFRLIHDYGYWVIALGSIVEGETIVAFGGLFAHRGLLSLPVVMLVAFVGSFLGDQVLFQIGKRYSPAVLRRFPKLQPPAERAFALLQRWQNLFILGFRFVYGVRTVSALVIGASGIGTWHFLVLNGIAAAVWAVSVAAVGFYFGHALDYVMSQVRNVEIALLGLLAVAVIIGFFVRRWHLRRQ